MAGSGYNQKEAKRDSGLTVERYRAPPNPAMADKMTQFIFDHGTCAKIIPDRIKGSLIEASTMADKTSSHQCINGSGRSAVFGPAARVEIGGSPDDAGLAGKAWGGKGRKR